MVAFPMRRWFADGYIAFVVLPQLYSPLLIKEYMMKEHTALLGVFTNKEFTSTQKNPAAQQRD